MSTEVTPDIKLDPDIDPLVQRMLTELPLLDIFYEFDDIARDIKKDQRKSVRVYNKAIEEGVDKEEAEELVITDDQKNRMYLDGIRSKLVELMGEPVNYTQADEFNDRMMYIYLTKKKKLKDAIDGMQPQLTNSINTTD